MSYDDNAKWFESMFPEAQRAHSGTGVPTSVILAHWALETGYGTSGSYREGNNVGGVRTASGPYATGLLYGHAKYATVQDGVSDYIRVMNLSYYDLVRSAGDPQAAIVRLDESPWAEDKQQGVNLRDIFSTYGLSGYDSYSGGGGSSGGSMSDIIGKVGSLSDSEMQKMAGIGLLVVAVMAFMHTD